MREFAGSAKHFLKRYDSIVRLYSSLKAPFRIRAIRNQGKHAIMLIDQIFSELGISYFIDFGTLLGVVREGGFIANDLDIDLGILDSSIDGERLQEAMEKRGLKKIQEFIFCGKVVEESYMFNGVKIDLFYYQSDKDSSWCYVFYRLPDLRYNSANEFSVFKATYSKITHVEYKKISGFNWSLPGNSERVLEEKYGQDWQTPDPTWSYKDAPSLKLVEGFGILMKN